MSIVQISKIQHRYGNLVDLPQLDEAELGWASDQKLLFIGKTTPNENVEVLTSYSHISFSQLDGTVGNLNISNVSIANGQILSFDGANWVNKGGSAGGLITLGDVANVKITGGAIGYVLETDGTGNLSWSPKGTISAFIQDVKKGNGAAGNLTVVTSVENNILTDGLKVTITDARGMTQLNGNVYYVDVQTSNTFALYTDAALTSPLNSSTFSDYAYTSVANTFANNAIKVGNSSPFTLNNPIKFTGDISSNGSANTNLSNSTIYYVKSKPSSTTITVSSELLSNGVAGNTVVLNAVNGITANVYETGGRVLCSLISSGGATANAAGSITSIQYNAGGLLGGSADFVFDNATKLMNLNGNANVGNLNASSAITGSRFISTVSTGTAPFTVNSTTMVPNLYASRSNVSDFGRITAQTTGVYYPTFVNGNTTANYALSSNGAFAANVANGSFTAITFVGNLSGTATTATTAGTVTTNAQPNITSVGTLTTLAVSGNVGIGTVSPVAALDVYKATGYNDIRARSGSTSAFIAADASSVGIGTYSNVPLLLSTNNSERMRIDQTGNVGIGTTTPSYRLDVGGFAAGTQTIRLSSASDSQIKLMEVNDTYGFTIRNVSASGLNIIRHSADSTGTSAMFIKRDTGEIGMGGNIAPSHGLALNGTFYVSGNANIGNVGATAFYGSGVGLTSIPGGNVSGPVANATYSTTAGTASGASGSIFATSTTGGESQLVVRRTGSADAYLYSNGTAWGLYSTEGGAIVSYTRSTGAVTLLGNITGSASFASSAGSVAWANVSGRPTAVSSLTNDVGYITSTVTGDFNVNNGNIITNRTVNSGNLSLSGNATISGSLTTSGNVSLSGPNVSLGAIGNLKISGGASGQLVRTDGAGNMSFVDPSSIATPPAGFNTQIQFNDGGVLGASAGLTFNKSSNILTASGNVVSGATLSGATLTTSGNATVGGNLAVTVSASINGALSVNGQVNMGSNASVTGNLTSSRIISTVASGTAPFTVTSNTRVANLNVASAGYADSAGTASTAGSASSAGYATNAGLSSSVSIEYNNDTNSTFQLLWGAGNNVYGTGGIFCNPANDIIYAGDFYVNSDDRLKTRISNINDALASINKLNGFRFNWNTTAKEIKNYSMTETQVGVSAQEVEAVLPEAVQPGKDGYKTVSYDSLVPLLIEAIKELTAKVERLEGK